jgi:hypothetical protein
MTLEFVGLILGIIASILGIAATVSTFLKDREKFVQRGRNVAIILACCMGIVLVLWVMVRGSSTTGPDTGGTKLSPQPTGPPPTTLDSRKRDVGATEIRRGRQAWAKYLGRSEEEEIDLGGGVKLKLVLIPPGKFMMGSPKEEKDRYSDEELHEVEITEPFYLGIYEVTQEQYEKVIGKNPSFFSAGGDGKQKMKGLNTSHLPVENVSWDDAVAFYDKLTEVANTRAARP